VVISKSETITKSAYILVNDKLSNASEIQKILDKGFVTEKEFKKLSKPIKNVETYASNNEDDFHIKLIN
jgi:hypothetical protein